MSDAATPSPPRPRAAAMPARPRSPARFTFARATVASALHPARNEDAVLADQGRALAAVFDGVGGSVAGEVAARLAARLIRQGWRRLLEEWRACGEIPVALDATHDVAAALVGLMLQAHEAISHLVLPDAPGDERRQSGAESAATTAAVAVLHRHRGRRGVRATFAWVGDSRIYMLRARGHLIRLTSDDGLLTRLVQDGIISEHAALRIDQAVSATELTDLGLGLFNRRNGITQSLGGMRPPDVHTGQALLRAGDRLLLCTDGIHDNLTDREIETVVRAGPRTTVARQLVARAAERGGEDETVAMRAKPDDMTALVVTAV